MHIHDMEKSRICFQVEVFGRPREFTVGQSVYQAAEHAALISHNSTTIRI